jgi:hypothetical protein
MYQHPLQKIQLHIFVLGRDLQQVLMGYFGHLEVTSKTGIKRIMEQSKILMGHLGNLGITSKNGMTSFLKQSKFLWVILALPSSPAKPV